MTVAVATPEPDAALERQKEELEQHIRPLLKKLSGANGEAVALNVFGIRRLKNLTEIFQAVEKIIDDAELKPKAIDLKVLSSLLEYASLQENQYLQRQWAALLANAATDSSKVHPRFPELLHQLSHSDALILDFLFSVMQKTSEPKILLEKVQTQFFHLSKNDFEIALDNLVGLNLIRIEELKKKPTTVALTKLGVALFSAFKKPPRTKPIPEFIGLDLGGRFDNINVREAAYE